MAETKKTIWKRWYMIVLYVFVGLIFIGMLLPDSNNASTQKDTTQNQETQTTQEKISLDELRGKLQNSLGSEPINSLTEDKGVYLIKYYFEPLNNKVVDEGIVEDFAFRIMTVFLNNVDDFKLIKIEASTTTPIKSGLISKATITKEQVLKYGADPYSINVEDFNEFTFDESFY